MATQHIHQQRGMRFTCDQRWEAMRPEGTDRYCEQCAKPVIDFTAWSRTDLKAWYAEHPETCGMFRIEQVDPGLVPVPELPRGLLNSAMAALAALTLHTAQAQVPTPRTPPTEQTPASTTTTHLETAVVDEKCWMEKPAPEKAVAPKPRARYYVSGRFPFVHKRRAFRTIGCPSF
ncbi:MAG: hypothetical protein JNL52_10435 [Flavobacteriales bacterium]|nr:hypothetical protein [Flavobacteriales bacterium]